MNKFKEFGYKKYKKVKSKFNKIILKKRRKTIELFDIISDLKEIGIEQGDLLFMHSSLKSLGYVEGGPNTVISALLKSLGPEGTLLVPTYPLRGTMYRTCQKKNYIFDLKKSSTELGAIPSAFLKQKNIVHSIHPTHSISAIGKYAKEATEKHHIGNKTYGENSPWGTMVELNGKYMGIGISLGPTTQYHYIEDIMGKQFPIKVKVDEIYKLKCKINENKYIYVEVQPLDPEVAKTRIDHKENKFIRDLFWVIFEKLGIMHVGKIGEAKSWWIYAKDFMDYLVKLAKIGITIYSTEEELKQKKLYPFDINKLRS